MQTSTPRPEGSGIPPHLVSSSSVGQDRGTLQNFKTMISCCLSNVNLPGSGAV